MLRQEYLVEYQKGKISLSSFALVTTSFSFPSFPLVLCSCTCTFSDPAQGLFWGYVRCRLCSMQLILCYPVPRVCLFRRCFIELYRTSPIGSISCLSRKTLLIHWGHLTHIHEEDENPGSNLNISLYWRKPRLSFNRSSLIYELHKVVPCLRDLLRQDLESQQWVKENSWKRSHSCMFWSNWCILLEIQDCWTFFAGLINKANKKGRF